MGEEHPPSRPSLQASVLSAVATPEHQPLGVEAQEPLDKLTMQARQERLRLANLREGRVRSVGLEIVCLVRNLLLLQELLEAHLPVRTLCGLKIATIFSMVIPHKKLI